MFLNAVDVSASSVISRIKGKAPTHAGSGGVESKLGVIVAVFFVSLFAVSFPSVSKRIKYIRIPPLVFFLGKHFGTGVILSTAFVHLLPDAFKALDSEWTGLIVLVSLLAIFLVEYISTAYVDHLQSYSSAPPTPTPSITPTSSRAPSISESPSTESSPTLQSSDRVSSKVDTDENLSVPLLSSSAAAVSYGTRPLASTTVSAPSVPQHHGTLGSQALQPPLKGDEIFAGSHHRHESRQTHAAHCDRSKKHSPVVDFDGEQDTPRSRSGPKENHHEHQQKHSHPCKHGSGHSHSHGHSHGHGHVHLDIENWGSEEDEELLNDDRLCAGEEGETCSNEEVRVGRRRQVVGILMLQIGIMLHSLVIGLTLAITNGPEFTTLVTAILFHQMFEGLSLGIRIAGLPSESKEGGISKLSSRILKPILTLTFALTLPLGIGGGLVFFSGGHHSLNDLKFIQGFMSAMSAGMLIYAACVEMLAGDFVMDPGMWRSSIRRQVMALVSLAAGVCAMALVGMWD